MTIRLPIQLDLHTCCKCPKHIQYSNHTETNINLQNQKQIQMYIKSYLPILTGKNYYPQQFVRTFLLIKLNSLAMKECDINTLFIEQLKQVYNVSKLNDIEVSNTEAEIFCQIINKIPKNVSLTLEELKNIVEGNALLAASAVWLAEKAYTYLRKQEIVFCLSFVALGGRQMAFTPIVHEQKNHAGQIYFANRIKNLVPIKEKIHQQELKVQDPYSMRCSPQVHGVAYDSLNELKKDLHLLINKSHFKYIKINGKKTLNLLLQSDTFSLKIDFLICCLQQIGAMAFLRLERILNEYLGKNKLKKSEQYLSLYSMMHSALSLISKNKLLCSMTNFDTSNIDSYNKDIFYNSGSYFSKITELLDNLYFVMTVQILSAIEAFRDILQGKLENVKFVEKETQGHFNYLIKATNPWDKNGSLYTVKEAWMH